MQLRSFICVLAVTASGCGYGVTSSTPSPGAAVLAPTIVAQPTSQSVPMGLPANFTVTAAGTTPQYQWLRNGTAIVGATASSYVSPPVTLADSGANFAVIVSNSAGTVTTGDAALTVTARAPAAGDLRFQQVDAASTVNGYGVGVNLVNGSLPGLGADVYASSIGTALWAGAAAPCADTAGSNAADCVWEYAAVPLPAAAGLAGLTAGFASDSLANSAYDLQDPNWPNAGNGASPADGNAVINSLDLEAGSQAFAVSWLQDTSNTQSSFVAASHSVAPALLAAAASTEGANGRVLTAVSYDAGEITYWSHGWSADTSSIYEAQTTTASAADAPAAAASLAAAGYIITAVGRADDAGDVVLVGTRLQGDTMARPFVIATSAGAFQTMMMQGYATVGVILGSGGGTSTYLGER